MTISDKCTNKSLKVVHRAYVFCKENIRIVGKICYLPIYMLMFLQKTWALSSDTVYKLDLTGLV